MKNQIRILMIVLLCTMLVGCGGAESAETVKEMEPGRSVVRVETSQANGSAILLEATNDGEVLLLTARHVLDGLKEGELPEVIFEDGERIACQSFVRSTQADAAVLTLVDEKKAKELKEEDVFLHWDASHYDALAEGAYCIAIGGGNADGRKVSTGTILDGWIYMEDYSQYMIWAECQISAGMSGGGLFDADGYFLGILSGGSEDGQLAAVPYTLLLAEELW